MVSLHVIRAVLESQKYKLFLMGNEAKTDGVGIFVAEKWADSVVRVERHSERIAITYHRNHQSLSCFYRSLWQTRVVRRGCRERLNRSAPYRHERELRVPD